MKIRQGRDSHDPAFDIEEKYWKKAKRKNSESEYIEYTQIKAAASIPSDEFDRSIYILIEGTSIVAANNYDYVCRDPKRIDMIWTVIESTFNRIYEKLEGDRE